MIHVLFDFEVDTSLAHPYPPLYYDKIRSLYLDCYKQQSLLIDLVKEAGGFPVMMLCFAKEKIRAVAFDMPDFVAKILHKTVRQASFKKLEQELITLFSDNDY